MATFICAEVCVSSLSSILLAVKKLKLRAKITLSFKISYSKSEKKAQQEEALKKLGMESFTYLYELKSAGGNTPQIGT